MISFFTGIWGKVAAAGVFLLAAAAAILKFAADNRKAGQDRQKVKDAEAREAQLDKLKDAIRAGNAVDPGVVYDDPHNRTRPKGHP